MQKYFFQWTSGYQNETDYTVSGLPGVSRLSLRHAVPPCSKREFNYTGAEWRRDVVASIGLLRPRCGEREPLPQDLVDEFNAWREADYWKQRHSIESQPERYGVVDWDGDCLFRKPVAARGAVWVSGAGWWINGEPKPAPSALTLHVSYELDREELSERCIRECSAPGAADEAVESWRVKLGFTVDRARAVDYLQSTGGWDSGELAASDDDDLARRVLWIACCEFREDSKSDLFVMGV